MPVSDWTTRDYVASDEGFVLYSWLKSHAHSRFGVSMRANVDESPGEKDYWTRHRPLVMRLIESSTVRVVCDPDRPEVIWAWACTHGEDVIHYVLAKRRFHQEGFGPAIFAELLGDRLGRPQRYSHELVELARPDVRAKLRTPESWIFDPYLLATKEAA